MWPILILNRDFSKERPYFQLYEKVRATFRAGKTKSIAYRKQQLSQLAHMCNDNRKEIEKAYLKDLGRPPLETSM